MRQYLKVVFASEFYIMTNGIELNTTVRKLLLIWAVWQPFWEAQLTIEVNKLN